MTTYSVYDQITRDRKYRVKVYFDSDLHKHYARIYYAGSGNEAATSEWYLFCDAIGFPSALGWVRKTIALWGDTF